MDIKSIPKMSFKGIVQSLEYKDDEINQASDI